ncbi:hypothetical protein BZA70DRAFT_287081 [Myxozyma melibiosi]|uniref:Uncharacterized protein n=1 Tax=Myxozyma melibiosi TaxID=54550 RepID=A0ABR1FD11_9ASCO
MPLANLHTSAAIGCNIVFLALVYYYTNIYSPLFGPSSFEDVRDVTSVDHHIEDVAAFTTSAASLTTAAPSGSSNRPVADIDKFTFTHTVTQYAPKPTWTDPQPCEDPYRRPGYLYIPPYESTVEYNTTVGIPYLADAPKNMSEGGEPWFMDSVYVPYYDNYLLHGPPHNAIYPPIEKTNNWLEHYFNDQSEIPAELLHTAPINWMRFLRELIQAKDKAPKSLQDSFKWLRNKRILIWGDAIDRDIVQHTCTVLGLASEINLYGYNTVSHCVIEQLNFTIFHWDLPSMYVSRPKWWLLQSMDVVAFENRTETVFKNHTAAVYGSLFKHAPDLILYQSLLYDWRADMRGRHEKMARRKASPEEIAKIPLVRPIRWPELDFYRVRQIKFVHHLRRMFGSKVPILYRTATPRNSAHKADEGMHALDSMSRLIAANNDIEVFEWGHHLKGYASGAFYDSVHVRPGPHSLLYSNMLLHYLFRAAGGVEARGVVKVWPGEDRNHNWGRCHDYNKPIWHS